MKRAIKTAGFVRISKGELMDKINKNAISDHNNVALCFCAYNNPGELSHCGNQLVLTISIYVIC